MNGEKETDVISATADPINPFTVDGKHMIFATVLQGRAILRRKARSKGRP